MGKVKTSDKVKTSGKVIATGNGYEVVQKAGITSANGDKVEIMRMFNNLQ